MTGHPGGDRLVLAVDGGASKTDVWLVDDEGSIRGRARGDGSNHQFFGLDGAIDAIDATVHSALADAGQKDGIAISTGVYCLAGVDLPIDEERVGAAVRTQGWSSVDVVRNDTLAVLRAGARSGWGVGVVCGSGLNCIGLGPDGRIERFPSLAELSGDFTPGGAWLGVRALGLALRSRDGRGGPTVLADLVPAHFDLPDPEAVLAAVYTGTLSYGRLLELARTCLEAAAAGDVLAQEAAAQLSDEVALMVTAMLGRLGIGGEEVDVVLGGGLFGSDYPGFSERVEAHVLARAPRARFQRLDAPPVLGAALLGLDAIGASPEAKTRLRVAARTNDSR